MGNTGAYMLRTGAYKLVTFGHTFSTFKNHSAQLFNVDEDPDELDDLAAKEPALVQTLVAKLNAIVDFE